MTPGAHDEALDEAVAVIGLAGRFPGARSVTEYWRNLCAGTESIVAVGEDALRAAGVGDDALASGLYVRRAALLDGVDEFDAEVFGLSAPAARQLDPQHRLFLQTVWHGLEDAGCDPHRIDGAVGVFGTSSASGYLLHNLMSHLDAARVIGEGASFEMISLSLQNDKDHLATRAAHQFDLRGPALSVQTACSSSLVAVHLAVQSILAGECDLAVAGGASIRVPHHVGYWHEPGSMTSPSGHCRPFDVRADGTVFGSGVGVVVLKPLRRAQADGDRIHAVIRGSAINNDGATKMTYAAPNAAGQAAVIAEAHAVAGVDAATIGYVETHGTGTPLGDPIEIDGLRQAFELAEAERTGPCVLGSVKANIGHLEVAAGIAGLIKAILCLEHGVLPGTLHYTRPNPELHLERSPFEVRAASGPWESAGPRRAGVSAFGVGGTNAHVVLEQAPAVVSPPSAAGPRVLLLSARDRDRLGLARTDLAAELAAGDPPLADVAHTLAGRAPDTARLAAVVRDTEHAVRVLRGEDDDAVGVGDVPAGASGGDGAARVVLLFPGQGAQHVGMARGLYAAEPVFARHFDECAAGFADELGFDLRTVVFDGPARELERTDRAQPALFAVEYALARLLESYGVRPAAVAGHSIGEYAAATVAGVFEPATAIRAVALRARLMAAAPRGGMLAVPLGQREIAAHLGGGIDLAAVNEPGGCVVAGTVATLGELAQRLAAAGVAARRVRTSHAFHSALMDPVTDEFAGRLARLDLRAPSLPLLSNVSGTWMTADEARDPARWARQIRSTVRFADELDAALAQPHRILVEVGPGGTLTSAAARHPRWSEDHRAVRLMRHPAQDRGDHETLLLGLGRLWAAGVGVDWAAGRPDTGRRVLLPGYPFARTRHWTEHRPAAPRPTTAAGEPTDAPAAAPAERTGSVRATLERVWAQCLGVDAVDPNLDFFEQGGDSLVAISVAMSAAHSGLELTPQDLYDNPTVIALARALELRYAAGGLAGRTAAAGDLLPVPPNVAHVLAHGPTDPARWRTPVVVRLRPDVTADDVRAVLTAITARHDALRLRLVRRAGVWGQVIGEPAEFGGPVTVVLPDGAPEDGVARVLAEQIAAAPDEPLTAALLTDPAGGPSRLALTLHGVLSDADTRDVLLEDLLVGFGQRMAGNPIELAPATASWREWSERAAALATHPAVLDGFEYWLTAASGGTLRPAADGTAGRPATTDLARVSVTVDPAPTSEIDDARRRLGVRIEELLLAALARAVGGALGAGTLAVDIGGAGRAVLKPDIELHRTPGWFTTVHPVLLACTPGGGATVAAELAAVRETVRSVPHHGIGYGLLRYAHAPTAARLAALPGAQVAFAYAGAVPEAPDVPDDAPVRFDPDVARPVRDTVPGLGHPIEVRAYRHAGTLRLDVWHDRRRVDDAAARALAEAIGAAALAVARAAIAEDEASAVLDELELIDLSELDGAEPGAGNEAR